MASRGSSTSSNAAARVAAKASTDSFAAMLRSGKFAAVTFDVGSSPPSSSRFPARRVAPFVLTARIDERLRGEWGLKHSRRQPNADSTALIARSLDAGPVGHRGAVRSGSRVVQEMVRWRELFGYNEVVPRIQQEVDSYVASLPPPSQKAAAEPHSPKAAAGPHSPPPSKSSPPSGSYLMRLTSDKPVHRNDVIHLDSLGRFTYISILSHAQTLRASCNKDMSNEEAFSEKERFLDRISSTSYVRHVHPPYYLVTGPRKTGPSDILPRRPSGSSSDQQQQQTEQSKPSIVLPPGVAKPRKTVMAYLLDESRGAHIMGILGFTANMSHNESAIRDMVSASTPVEVEITSVRFDPQGRPEIEVSNKTLEDKKSTPISAGFGGQRFNRNAFLGGASRVGNSAGLWTPQNYSSQKTNLAAIASAADNGARITAANNNIAREESEKAKVVSILKKIPAESSAKQREAVENPLSTVQKK